MHHRPLSRVLAAIATAVLIAQCGSPAAAPQATSGVPPATVAAPAAATTAPRDEPTPRASAAPATATAEPPPATATAQPAVRGDDAGQALARLVYRAPGGLYATERPGAPPRLLAPVDDAQRDLPWAAAPDGSALAFVRSTFLENDAGQPSIELYVVAAGIAGERKLLDLLPPGGVDLTPGEEASMGLLPALTSNQRLAWAPDSSRVVVASAHEGQVDLYSVTPDGTTARLTSTAAIETMPTWSGDGALVAAATLTTFGTGAGWGDVGLAVVRGDGGSAPLPALSLDAPGAPLAVADLVWAGPETLLVGLPGSFGPGMVRAVDVRGGGGVIFSGDLRGMAWSAAAGALAIGAGSIEGAGGAGAGLYLWRPGEGEARRAAEVPAAGAPVWSATGAWVALNAEGDEGGVWMVPADPERRPFQLTATAAYDVVWSPDGGLIATGGDIWHRNGSPVDPLPGIDARPLAWTEAGLFFVSRDEPGGDLVLGLWSETGASELDRGVVPFDARPAVLQLPPAERLDPAGLLPDTYRSYEGADGIVIAARDPATGAERDVGAIPFEPGGISRAWTITPSPDGRRLAVTASGSEPATLLYVVEDGRARLLSGADADDWVAEWSPDSTRLLVLSTRGSAKVCEQYTCPFDIYSIDVATGARTQLTATEAAEPRATWSPDGTLVAFTRGCSDRGNESCGPSLYLMSAAGGGERLLAEGWVDSVTFSPDGRQIAFTQDADGFSEIYVVSVEGGPARRIAHEEQISAIGPRWSPDGRALAYARIIGVCQVEACAAGVSIVAADGGAARPALAPVERSKLLAWRWSAEGRLLVVLRLAEEEARVLAYAPDGALRGEARVTLPQGVAER